MNYRKLAVLGTAGTAAAIATVGTSAYIITKTLVDIALDHDPPAILTTLKGKITHCNKGNAFLDEMRRTEALLLEKKTEEVETEAFDGTILKGHILEAERPERIIIAFHGWRARWSRDFGMISEFWQKENATVLYVEQRGQNSSPCEHMGFGAVERLDCLDWVNYICNRYRNSLPIYLAGISMGATTVLMAADFPFPSRVHGIMADCGFTSADNIWQHVVHDNLHLPYGLRRVVADHLCRKKTGYGSDEINTLRTLKGATVPVLFLHGLNDHFVPVEMTWKNYEACTSEKRIHLVPGADHGMAYFMDRAGYEDSMRRFWADFD